MAESLPAWVWDLLVAVLNYEDEHTSSHPCMLPTINAVPIEARYAARAIDEYNQQQPAVPQ